MIFLTREQGERLKEIYARQPRDFRIRLRSMTFGWELPMTLELAEQLLAMLSGFEETDILQAKLQDWLL